MERGDVWERWGERKRERRESVSGGVGKFVEGRERREGGSFHFPITNLANGWNPYLGFGDFPICPRAKNFGGAGFAKLGERSRGFNMSPIHVEHVETIASCDSLRLSPAGLRKSPTRSSKAHEGGGHTEMVRF